MLNISITIKAIRQIQAYCGKDWTMPSQQVMVLLLIMSQEEVSLNDLKERAHIAQPSCTRALDILEGHGLIHTWIEGRGRKAALTPAGMTLRRDIQEMT